MDKDNPEKETTNSERRTDSPPKTTKTTIQTKLPLALSQKTLPMATKPKKTKKHNNNKTKTPNQESATNILQAYQPGTQPEDSIMDDVAPQPDAKLGIAHRRPKDHALGPDSRPDDEEVPSVSPWSESIREWNNHKGATKATRAGRLVSAKELFGEDDSSEDSDATQYTSNTALTNMTKLSPNQTQPPVPDDGSIETRMSESTFLQDQPSLQSPAEDASTVNTHMSEVSTLQAGPTLEATFVTFKMELGSITGNSGFPQIRALLAQVFQALTEADPHAALLYYDPKSEDYPEGTPPPTLVVSDDTTWFGLRPYTARIPSLNSKSKPVAYMTVRLQHTRSLDEIKDILASFDLRVELWKKKLQVPSSMEIGWLLFSHKQMPTQDLEDILSKALRHPISLRWRRQPGFETSEDNGWELRQHNRGAFFVEVPLPGFDICRSRLKTIYPPISGSAAKKDPLRYVSWNYPLGIMLSFVVEDPQGFRRRSRHRTAQLNHGWDNQESFVLSVVSITSTQFIDLDTPVNGWGEDPNCPLSVREMMMSLAAPKTHHRSLLHSLSIRYQGSTLVTTALAYPQWETQATHVMAFPLTHLRQLIPHADESSSPGTMDNLNAHFTRQSVEEADDTRYSHSRKQVVNRGRTRTLSMVTVSDPHLQVFVNPDHLAKQLKNLGITNDNVSPLEKSDTIDEDDALSVTSDISSHSSTATPPKKRATATATPERHKTPGKPKADPKKKRQRKTNQPLPGQGYAAGQEK